VEETTQRRVYLTVLLTKYFSGDKMKKNEMGGACVSYGERRGALKDLVGRPDGKKPLGRLKLIGSIMLK
jgi:hypothetical protein